MFAEFVTENINHRNTILELSEFKNEKNVEAYRSLFLFEEELKTWVQNTGSVKGFEGRHISDFLIFDFDGEDLSAVKNEAINFCLYLEANYDLNKEFIEIFFSGSKGFHICIPMECITENLSPALDFWKTYKSLAIEISRGFNFADTSIYEIRRIIRLPNSLHPKSKLYKVPITFSELKSKSVDEIKIIAQRPREIEKDIDLELNENLLELYNKLKNKKAESIQPKPAEKKSDELLTILENGASEGNRHLSLVRITSALMERGITYDFILAILKNWNLKNKPVLTIERLEAESKAVFETKTKAVDSLKIYSLRDAANEYRDFVLKQESRKVNIGYPLIDKKLRAILPGETCCILGKTSVGKSAFLQNIGLNYAKKGEPVLFFSLEMPITSVFERSVQINSGLTGFHIEAGIREKNLDVYRECEKTFIAYPNFNTITKSGLSLEDIKVGIIKSEEAYKQKTGLVLIDYLGLVKGKGKDIYEKISEVARGMKDLAKEMDVPIIFLSQVTKAFSEYTELELGAARDSGAIDEASDFILGLWKEKDNRPEEDQLNIPLMLGILKNRKGGLGKIEISLEKKSLKVNERSISEKAESYKNNGSKNWYERQDEELPI